MRVTARDLVQKGKAVRPRRERDTQHAILEALRAIPGVVAWKTGAGSFRVNGRYVRMGHRGVSDIVGWRQWRLTPTGEFVLAQFIAVEVKQVGKQPTAEQRAFLDAVQAAGGLAVCAYSVDDVLAALR